MNFKKILLLFVILILGVFEIFSSNALNYRLQPDKKIEKLFYAIRKGDNELVKKLIVEKCDVNQEFHNKLPLMYCIKLNKFEIFKTLIDSGADVNKFNSEKESILNYAIYKSRFKFVDLLIKSGVKLNEVDVNGLSSIDLAYYRGDREIIALLKNNGAKYSKSNHPSCYDGPHYRISNISQPLYYVYDSLSSNLSIKNTIDNVLQGDILNKIKIKRKYKRDKNEYKNVKKIAVIGDIHGHYDKLVENLQKNKIIDKDFNWIFGKGHLVFVGDIFDRGEKVTECLWLIYYLEQKAKKKGGKVHLLVGNHELMVFFDDIRYINEKYFLIGTQSNIHYSDMFNNKTVLGKWIRSKNLMVKINDKLFVHGGISPFLVSEKYTIKKVNKEFHKLLNNNSNDKVILSSLGPVWYRGFFMKRSRYDKIKESQLDNILNFYKVNNIIVGHTEFDFINSYYDSKVYNVNIPLYKKLPSQLLLFENKKAYKMFDGEKKEL